MKSIRKKQMVVLFLVVVVIAAGVLQYNYNQNNLTSGVSGENPDFADFVNNPDNDNTDQVNSDQNNASVEANAFFAQAKLDRDIEYSKNTSYLKELSTDASAEKNIQEKAYEQFVGLMEESEIRTRIESMIKEKDYEDVFVAFGDDGSVDVVIKTPSLSKSEVAQISDIVSRQANVEIPMIHIRPIY